MERECPYCSLAKKKGELYCSRHNRDMSTLESGIFYINEKSFEECDYHVTRLSLNFNLDNTQSYFIQNREYKVSPQRYLLINQGQSFTTLANAATTSRMVTIAFRVGLAAELTHAYSQTYDQLLDNPDGASNTPTFWEKTYSMDEVIFQKVLSLIKSDEHEDQQRLNDEVESLLIHFLSINNEIRKQVLSIRKIKVSTKKEIYKRINWAVEHINNNYCTSLTIDQLAQTSCLSPFHFKRLFKEVVKETPYQYIKLLRLQRAKELLSTDHPVNEICRNVGWDDPSSFIRLFKKYNGLTPGDYRKITICKKC
jgi:AraC family transcriptional regulator